MIASVHIADVGVRSALSITRTAPAPGSIPGLRNASVGLAAPLGGSIIPSVQFGRAGLFAFWEDDAALDGFLADHPLAARFDGGWRVRLDPLRAYGTWPGFPREEIPDQRHVEHEGPVAALTMGRPYASQLPRFLKTSAKAEASAVKAPGLTWTTGLAKPLSFVATCSLWESTRALSTFAYGTKDPGHPDAITKGDAKPFHHEQIFIRFRPYAAEGQLEGKNPLEVSLPA